MLAKERGGRNHKSPEVSARHDKPQPAAREAVSAPIRSREVCPCGGGCPRCVLQAKLAIGPVDDPLEREADHVADQVMRVPSPALSISGAAAQVSRKCTGCEKEDEEKKKLQMKPAGGARPVHEAPAIVQDVLRSPGRSLDSATRAFMEPRFGFDFSEVRVHDGAQAVESAKSVNALAYTVRNNVVFNVNQYQPGSSAGQRLLAHELTHVVQQSSEGGLQLSRKEPPDEEVKQPAPAAKQAVLGKDSKRRDYVVYEKEIRVGGTRPWRNNNPGNFDKPEAHPKNIGNDGRFLIFPDPATGKQELIDNVKAHGTSSIRSFITAHAPPSENPTETYIKEVVGYLNNGDAIGDCKIKRPAKPVNDGTGLGTLSESDQSSFAMAVAREEGWCDVTKKKDIYNCQSASIPDEYKGKLVCPQ